MSIPTQVVILGASGDLTARKLVPALFSAWGARLVPGEMRLVGVARRPWDDAAFRAHLVAQTRVPDAAKESFATFLGRVHYIPTNLDTSADYQRLGHDLERLAGGPVHRVFYLAIKPELFLAAVEGLSAVGLLQQEGGLTRRVVVEKPFGHDLESARRLNARLLELLGEDQLYRIDHYLGKETVQNLLVFRFRNAFFEPLWNQRFVELVQITVAENLGMEGGRGGYYDSAGAVCDVLQNHLLQLLALAAMEPPADLSPKSIRDEKVKVLRALRGVTEQPDPRTCIVRGQYDGYRSEPGVATGSQTETWIAVRAFIDNWRWGGVPFLLRTGKHMPARSTSITVQFRMPPHTLFGGWQECHLRPNKLTLRIQPDDGISLDFEVKEPGKGIVIKPAKLDFSYAEHFKKPAPDAYERLLLDVIAGDQTLFIRSDEVEESWRWADSLRQAMAATPLHPYFRGSWGPVAADGLFGACEGRWTTA